MILLDSQWVNFISFLALYMVYLKKFELFLGLVVEEESSSTYAP